MKKIFVILLIIVLVALGYNYIKTNYGTKKLNVTYSIEDATKLEQSIGTTSEMKTMDGELQPQDSVVNSGTNSVLVSIDNVQATALLNKWAKYWSYAPLVNSSVVINSDNTVEYSGEFDLNRALGYANATGVSAHVVDAVKKYIQPFGANFPIYAKGTVSIENNSVNADFTDFKIGIVPVISVVNQYEKEANSFASQRLSPDSKYKVNKLDVSDGKINVDAVLPTKVEYYSK